MARGKYQITASLNIDNKDANQALDEATKKMKDLDKTSEKHTKTQNKVNKSNKDSANSQSDLNRTYKTGEGSVRRLTSGLNKQNKANTELMKTIKNTHISMVKQQADNDKYYASMSKIARDNGLMFRNGTFVDSLRDVELEMKSVGIETENVSKAMKYMDKEFNLVRGSLKGGESEVANFEKNIKEIRQNIYKEFGVKVSPANNGVYEFSDTVKTLEDKLSSLNKVMKTSKSLMANSIFTTRDYDRLIKHRDALGEEIMGYERYNEVLKTAKKNSMNVAETENIIYKELQKLNKSGQLHEKHITRLNDSYKSFMGEFNKYGGNMAMAIDRTGNYNKLITQTTRSQRMQNYAMQVSALRYNAIGTMAGFVGGMLVQQLAMGFAEARIQAVQFEQQAQQMLKTSKLTVQENNKLSKSVESYAKAHRKLNTQGLKYTVASVTKLNGLTEQQAERAIPVISDITNMMVLNGRSQEEAVLAVNDALDGQFKRLQEIGVQGKKQLESLGWTGNLNTNEDVMSLIDALNKLDKRKGWGSITDDISTLDDAYNVLGNTIDDVITPAVTSITPSIVNSIKWLSDLLGVFVEMPLPIQGVATALGVLGTAFAKMKLSMVWAKIESSEVLARFMGLDDGMYSLTNSVGSVTTAVRDSEAGFQEGVEALMNYHQAQMNVSHSFEEYNKLRSQALFNMDLYNDKLKTATEEEIAYLTARRDEYKLQYESLGLMRDRDVGNVQSYLALKNLTNEESKLSQVIVDGNEKRKVRNWLSKNEFNNISKTLGLTKQETHEFLVLNEMFDSTEGKYHSLNHSSTTFQKTLNKLNLTTKSFDGSLKQQILHLSNSGKTANKVKKEFTELNNVQKTNTGLLSSWKRGIDEAGGSIKNFIVNGLKNSVAGFASFTIGIGESIVSLLGFQVVEEEVTATTAIMYGAIGAIPLAIAGIGIAIGALTLAPLLSQQQQAFKNAKNYHRLIEAGNTTLADYDAEHEKKLSKINEYHDESVYNIKKQNGLITTQDEEMHKLYGSGYKWVQNLEDATSEYKTQLGFARNIQEQYSKNPKTKNFAEEVSGWKTWEAESLYDYRTSEDWFTTIQSGLALNIARAGNFLTQAWYDTIDWGVIGKKLLTGASEMIENLISDLTSFLENGNNSEQIGNNIAQMIIDGCQWIWNNRDLITKLAMDFLYLWGLVMQTITIELPKTIGYAIYDLIISGISNVDWNNVALNILSLASPMGVLICTGIYNLGNKIYQYFSNGIGNLGNVINQKILDVKTYINNWFNKIGQDAYNFGKNIWTQFKNGLGNLSKIITDEINEIWTEIKNAPSKIAQDAWNFGKSIVDGVNKDIDHHSPGKIARMIRDEIIYVKDFIKNGSNSVSSVAQDFGASIVNGVGNIDLSSGVNVIGNNNAIMASTNKAQTYTATQYGAMTNTVTNAFGIMSDTANTDMNNVAMNNATYLTQMNKDTKSNMTQIQTTTDGKLKTMQSTTITATNNMTKAWDIMRNNIVNSASQIRNQSYAKFSSLHRSIAGFYRQIQSASFSGGLPAGEPNTNTLSSRTIRKRQSSPNKIGYAGISDDYLKLLDKKGRSEKDIEKFYLKYPEAIPPNSKAIAGNGIAQTHTNKQYNTAKNWSIKDPTMYGVLLNMGYKVSDFDGKSPSISNVTDFERILTQLFTAHPTSYDFYFNSQKSNEEAWNSGSFNCFDGAELVMEIANDLGFGASMAHGTWNGIPHVSAVVGGRLFDTTQWQKRGVWRGASGVNFGGFAGSPDKGRRVKWSSPGRGRFAGPGNTTTNNSNKKIVVNVTGNNFIGLEDYKKQMENIAEDVFYDKMSVNPCTGI